MSTHINRLGLSLSGGGYRAAAFHLGTLNKLQEMGILQRVDVLSTISGGSITGAYYCLNMGDYAGFANQLYAKLQTKNVIQRVLLSPTFFGLIMFALIFLVPAFYFLFQPGYSWLFPTLLAAFIFLVLKFQFQIFPVSTRIEKIYDEFFYQNANLEDLPDKPTLVIGSTNLQTGRPFTFSRRWMQDSTYQFRKPSIQFKAGKFPVARAVMASSCVPFAFTPIKIEKEFFKNRADADDIHPLLVDGGVYDNQGIHKIVQRGSYACQVIITSDAGGGASGELRFRNTIALLLSTVEVFMSRIKKAQMVQNIYANADTANRQIAYYSLGWDIDKCIPGFIDNLEEKQVPRSVIDAHLLHPSWVEDPRKYETEILDHLKARTGYDNIHKPTGEEIKIARGVATNLTSLSKQQVDCLVKQAASLTELQVKLYCPSLIQNT